MASTTPHRRDEEMERGMIRTFFRRFRASGVIAVTRPRSTKPGLEHACSGLGCWGPPWPTMRCNPRSTFWASGRAIPMTAHFDVGGRLTILIGRLG